MKVVFGVYRNIVFGHKIRKDCVNYGKQVVV